ncbi:MAG: hypothetical protein U5N56_07325 [Candidatus Marinimicrobia bacterium]|nr:hypothetical protein [Candidatus Neomarinimicrobiota bacterium]
MKKFLMLMMAIVLLVPLQAGNNGSLINAPDRPVKIFFEVETGLVGVLNHYYQSGRTEEGATRFDFVNQGGQDVLFPFDRYNAGFTVKDKHKFGLLYQPLTVNTDVTFREDVMIDSTLFSAGTPMEIKYGFPFYRFTYSYFFVNNEKLQLAGGAALQVRNASIVFKAVDGSALSVAQNVGLVPSFNLYGRYTFDGGLFFSLDATGLYASSAVINGANFDFEGSLLDASLRMGYPLRKGMEVFGNLRFLGGTSRGESQYPAESWSVTEERYGENFLGTMAFTMGISLY